MAGLRAPHHPYQRPAMAGPSGQDVKFLSYNSTGLNPVKAQWIRDLMDTCDASFLGIQEHFKKLKTLQRYFQTEFRKCDSYVLPAHREEFRDTGRAQGGLAQLKLKSLRGVRQERVVTMSWRIQAQILHFGEWRLLWVNVYFPTDPRVVNFDETELRVVQVELQAVLDRGGYDGCLCAGDWNYDARRTSGFARSMAGFLDRVGLVSVWEKFPIDFTYMHTDHKSTSVLDNFYVNAALLPYVQAAGPMHLGDNPSGHSPILLSLRVADIPRKPVEEEVRVPRRLAWERAEDSQVKQYKKELKARLEELEDPDSLTCVDVRCSDKLHSKERDRHVLDIMSAWIEASYSTIPLVPAPRPPTPGKERRLQLPGWKENCEPLSKEAKFWYSVWLSAGRPATGELHRIMVATRVKFRAAVRRARCEVNTARARTLLQAAQSGDKALLQEMRSVLGSKHQVQELPDSLEGAVGHTAMLEKFRSLYESLYNSAGTEGRMEELSQLMKSMTDCRSESEVRKVTAEEVREACKRIKGGKIDVTNSYSSDVLRHAPAILYDKLAAIFRSFLTHGTITLSILSCSFMPLLKSARKDPSQFDSWRAVAGASQLLKLFEYVILNIWGGHLQSDTLQFGFKPGTGTDQCTWLLHTVAEHYLLRGSPTLCCLLDVRKGFPSVRFGDLFEICLFKKKLPVIVCRVLAFMYHEQTGFIKLRGRRSPPFRLTNGMREGAACSPILWAVYADGLLVMLRQSGLGCHVAGVWMGGFLYADDLSLIAPTRAILSSMLALVEAFGASLNLTFSSSQDHRRCKSFCIYFVGPRPVRRVVYPSPLVLNGVTLPWRESAIHLGHTLHQDLTFNLDATVRRATFISRSVEVRSQFSFAAPSQILMAVRLLCCDSYGSVLWRLSSQSVNSYFKAYSSCVRRIYRLPLNTFTYLVEGHFSQGLAPLRNMVLGRYPAFFQRMAWSACSEVSLMAELAAQDARTITASNLAMVSALTKLDCAIAGGQEVKHALPVQ